MLVAVVAIAINTVIIKPQLEKLGTLVVIGMVLLPRAGRHGALLLEIHRPCAVSAPPLYAPGRTGYILILGTVLPMYLLYRGTGKTDLRAYGPFTVISSLSSPASWPSRAVRRASTRRT